MRGKTVILVTMTMLIMALLVVTANSQVWVGDHSPTVAYNPLTHRYLAVHERYGNLEESPRGIFIDLWGNIVNSVGPLGWNRGYRSKPSTGYDSVNNRYLTVWADGSPYLYLFGQLLDANGNPYPTPFPWGSESGFLVSTAPGSQTNPIVTFDSVNGRFLVTWIDDRNVDGLSIYGQFISAEGELEGTEFLIQGELDIGYGEIHYSVAYDHVNQKFLMVWGLELSISGQFINTDGIREGEVFTIVENPSDTCCYDVGDVSVAYDGLNQRYLVAWDQMVGSVLGQLVNADGTLYGTSFYFPYGALNPSVAFDNVNQRFLVAWTGYDGTSGQFINSEGGFQGGVIPIVGEHNAVDGSSNPPDIAFNPQCGNFLVASVTKKYVEISDLYIFRHNLNFNIVGDPCPSATLTVKIKGYGGKRKHISGAGMNCVKNICSGQYWPGSEIDIGAHVDGKEVFVTWTGCDAMDGYGSCHITMDYDKNVTAKFAKVPKRSR
jgi:hypothetical protein